MLPKLATRGLIIQSIQALCARVCVCVRARASLSQMGLLLEKHSPETCGWLPWLLGNLNCRQAAGEEGGHQLACLI